jgi:hypothetical protein
VHWVNLILIAVMASLSRHLRCRCVVACNSLHVEELLALVKGSAVEGLSLL